VGEALESKAETIKSLSLQHAANTRFNPLNSVLLIRTSQRKKAFGIPDEEFQVREGMPNLVVKKPIRLMNLSQLDLYNRKTFWDIGFGAGSMSIEVKKQFPFLNVFSFEKRDACEELLEANTKKHSTPGLTKVIADIIGCDLSIIAPPDAIFLGEQDYNQTDLLKQLDKYMLPKGRMVINVKNDEDKAQFVDMMRQLSYAVLEPVMLKSDHDEAVTIITVEKR
jgi:precorrin-6Y C5,15-methyltransferase (decarboxylating)